MRLTLILAALLLCANAACAAEFTFDGSRHAHRRLFSQDAESMPRATTRPPVIDDDELPNPNEDLTRAGDWAVGIWGALPLRFFDHPSVEAMGGGGIDFLFRSLDTLGCFFSASLWAGRVKTKSGDWTKGESQIHSEFDAFELVTGARAYAHRWGSGAIYLDLRLAYLVVDGADPVLRTQSAGGDVYFGIEIGRLPVTLGIAPPETVSSSTSRADLRLRISTGFLKLPVSTESLSGRTISPAASVSRNSMSTRFFSARWRRFSAGRGPPGLEPGFTTGDLLPSRCGSSAWAAIC
jgi:hypothetical protein